MRLHRFIGDFDFSNEHLTISDAETVNQMKNVLRLDAGDKLILGNGKGDEAEATIQSIDKKEIVLSLDEIYKNETEPRHAVMLFCSILKKENFELVAQKATEIGIARIVPVISDRTIKQNIDRKRIMKIIKEASEQSGRGKMPELSETLSFEQAVAHAGLSGESILFDGSGESAGLAGHMSHPASFFIGPEGGWTESEIALARSAGLAIRTLGKLTLRAETAAIVSSYLLVQ